MRHVSFPVIGAGVLLFVSGCADPSSPTGPGGTGGSGGSGACQDKLADATNSEFCQDDRATIDCSLVEGAQKDQVCGVPLRGPTTELTRSANVEEYAGSGPPQLDCFKPGSYPTAGTSAMVSIKGFARIFSNGCESNNLKIEAYTVKRTGGADEADLDALVAFTMTVKDCTIDGDQSEAKCGTRYECPYEITNVPSETELLIKTSGDFWADLYDYNVFIPTAEVTGGVWNHDVRALAADDYTAIPQVALGGPVSQGNGVAAGEVHDCGNVRLVGATVGTDVKARAISYFTDDEDSPLPAPFATATSTLSLYAAFDVKPGVVTMSAVGLVGGTVTTVGYYRARVFPDSVTSVTFRGLRPYQVPATQ
jgi:hypothetical protein